MKGKDFEISIQQLDICVWGGEKSRQGRVVIRNRQILKVLEAELMAESFGASCFEARQIRKSLNENQEQGVMVNEKIRKT